MTLLQSFARELYRSRLTLKSLETDTLYLVFKDRILIRAWKRQGLLELPHCEGKFPPSKRAFYRTLTWGVKPRTGVFFSLLSSLQFCC
jgi:hypothetical protein